MPTLRQRLLTSGLVMPPSQWMWQLMDPDSTSMTWWARRWERRPLNPALVSILKHCIVHLSELLKDKITKTLTSMLACLFAQFYNIHPERLSVGLIQHTFQTGFRQTLITLCIFNQQQQSRGVCHLQNIIEIYAKHRSERVTHFENSIFSHSLSQ